MSMHLWCSRSASRCSRLFSWHGTKGERTHSQEESLFAPRRRLAGDLQPRLLPGGSASRTKSSALRRNTQAA